jgi:protein-disulfide isomerase
MMMARVSMTGLVVLAGLGAGQMSAQALPSAPMAQGAKPAAGAAAPAKAAAPLKLYTLNSETQADPFPAVNPKNFTTDSPSVAAVDGYLKTMLGFDPNRIWRVMAIQKTETAGVSKVTAMVAQRGGNAKAQTATFFVMPDGKHMLAGDAMTPFGAQPFADARALLAAKADGAAHGAAAKDLMIVEFSDLQCPHCKDAQATMHKLEADFPKARFVYQAFPLTEIHPYAFQAAAYGVCMTAKSDEAYATFAQAVYDTQGALLPDSADTALAAAVTKAGGDPAAVAACAASQATKAKVTASMELGNKVGVDQTPMIAVNGRLLAFPSIPYETLKQLIVWQATLDGVAAAAASPNGVDLKVK